MTQRRRGQGRKHYLRAKHASAPKQTKHLQKLHVKRDDLVEVISGEDKGKRGKIMRTLRSEGKVVVQGINRRWKHLRRSQENPQGGRIERESPIHASKVRRVD